MTEYEIRKWKCFDEDTFSFLVKSNSEIKGDMELLNVFINELDTAGNDVLDEMERIEKGELEEGYWGGNIASATYNKEKAYLEFDFDSPRTCELPTKMLKELVEAWVREKAKFDAENKK